MLRTSERGRRTGMCLSLVALLAAGSFVAQGAASTALAGSRLIRTGGAVCNYDGEKLTEIRVAPPEARNWPGRHKSYAQWQAVLQKKASNGTWRRVAATGFDPPLTILTGSSFKRLAPSQRFAATLPENGYLRVKAEVKWETSKGSVLGRKEAVIGSYKGSPTRGCISEKNPSSAEGGSPIWWGKSDRNSLKSGSKIVETGKGLEPVVGDFDGDGEEDILWYDTDGDEKIWWGRVDRTFKKTRLTLRVGAGMRPTAGDFDGDGRDDVHWYRPDVNNDFQWWGAAGRAFDITAVSEANGTYDQVVSGDYNGDGYDDLFFYRHPDKTQECGYTGDQYFWYGRRERTDMRAGSTPLTVPCYFKWFVGDADGDGNADLLSYGLAPNPRDVMWFRGASSEEIRFDQPYGFRPVMGDFDGDKRADIFWFSPSTEDSQWWGPAERSEFLTGHRTTLNINGDYYPVSGDFDGNGKDDILWYAK